MIKPTAIPTLFEYTKKKPPPRSSNLRQIRQREVLNFYETCPKSTYVNVTNNHHPHNMEEICIDNSPSYPDHADDDGMICEESNLIEAVEMKADTKEILNVKKIWICKNSN
jgi:hypothetical protein